MHMLHILLISCKLRCSCQEKEQERVNSFSKFRNEALFCKGTFDSLIVQNIYRESRIAHLRQECHNLKFGIFELLV